MRGATSTVVHHAWQNVVEITAGNQSNKVSPAGVCSYKKCGVNHGLIIPSEFRAVHMLRNIIT